MFLKSNKINRILMKFLELFTFYNGEYDLKSDLRELYCFKVKEEGRLRAGVWIWKQAVCSFYKSLIFLINWNLNMFKNYLTIAVRNINRHKIYSLINISGLSIGIACCVLITLWMQNELSYDSFHEQNGNIFRVMRLNSVDLTSPSVVTPMPLAPALKAELPEVLSAVRTMNFGQRLMRYGQVGSYESGCLLAGPDFFRIFSFPVVKGSAETALEDKYSIVISEQLAEKYFGKDDAVGKVITLDNRLELTVTGILKKSGYNSHLNFNYLLPFQLFEEYGADLSAWGDVSYITYVLLQPQTDQKLLKEKTESIIARTYPEYSKIAFFQAVEDIYFDRAKDSIFIFTSIALLILLIACVNYMNLATARSAKRAMEVSMRKVAGASRGSLIKQFLGESVLLSFFALLLAFGLAFLARPVFENITGKQLYLDQLLELNTLLILITVTMFTGLFSGLYPALFLSGLRPVSALKCAGNNGIKRSPVRKILVTGQYAVSIILIFATMVVYQQVDFLKNSDLGFDKEDVIYVPLQGKFKENAEMIKHELMANTGIKNVTLTDRLPGRYAWGTDSPEWEGKTGDMRVQFTVGVLDPDFLNTFKLEMALGRFFSEKFSTDKSAYVLNESAVKAMNIKSPAGKWFEYAGRRGIVIGVIKDFNFRSLYNRIEPLILIMRPKYQRIMCLKINSSNVKETVALLENKWQEHSPEFPFEYGFLDENLQSIYNSEEEFGTIVRYFSLLALFISCLGLLGLISFIAEQKTKEIGIRKTLGASMSEIIRLLTLEFVKLILISAVIALPAAYLVMTDWLNNFAYQTAITWWVYPVSGFSALFISLIIISIQAARSASQNPVDSLRYE